MKETAYTILTLIALAIIFPFLSTVLSFTINYFWVILVSILILYIINQKTKQSDARTETPHNPKLNITNNSTISQTSPTTIKKLLNYTNIPNRRPYNKESFKIEKTINSILSSEQDLEGKQLVNLVIKIFEKIGYIAINNDGYNDEKQDILIYKKENNTNPIIAIQCKSYSPQTNSKRIKKDDISQFMGHTEKFGKNRIYITSSYFHKKAIDRFSNEIILIDRIGLIHLLYKYFPLETINVLNSSSLHEIKETCEKCGHGKLHLMYYNNIPNYKCTNCGTTYSSKNYKPYKAKEWQQY